MAYELTVKTEFSAAHNLRAYRGKCEHLHGHNWTVELRVQGERLNDEGMLMDFVEIKRLLALVLDLAVPPLTLLGILTTGTVIISGLATLVDASNWALIISTINLAVFVVAIALAWFAYGRDVLPGRSLVDILPYAFRKLGLYARIVTRGPISQWIRTDRE